MLFDTHSHLNFSAFSQDRDFLIKEALSQEIWLINVGTNYQTSKEAVEIAQSQKEGVFAAIGLHPINLETGLVRIKNDDLEGKSLEKEFDFEKYYHLAKSKKVVAIGEIGLDYYQKPKTKKRLALFKEKQKELFLKELKLAQDLKLPVIFHSRMAHQDLKEILSLKIKGVMHGFVGNAEQLREYLKMDFYIGFNGIIFKKITGIDFDKNIKMAPLKRILIETDCPYLTPPGFSGEKNTPLAVKFIAEYIAKIKNISFEKVAETTTQNAQLLFKI